MSTIDLVASALDTLAAYLDAGLGTGYTARRGWPEHNAEFDLGSGPILTAVASEPERVGINPISLGIVADGEGGIVTTYKVAAVSFVVQLDAFAGYRAALDDLIPSVEALLHNKVPSTSDLWLTQGSYHGRPLRFSLESGPRRTDASEATQEADWRATWMLRCETDEVSTATHPAPVTIETTYEFQEPSGTVTETEIEASGD